MDPLEVLVSIRKLIEYNWEDELKSFQEETEFEIQSQDSLECWIGVCEARNIDHIFYHLMKLKQYYEN